MKRTILLAIALLLLASFALYFYVFKEKGKEKGELVLYGNVDIRQVDLGFRVFGRVQTLFFDEGDHVKAGELMACLDKTPYVEEVNQAKARVAATEADLKSAEAKFVKREKVLAAAISREDYEDALYVFKALQETLEEQKAALASSVTNCNDTDLVCPTDGTILTRIREPGSVLNLGEPVFTLALDSPIWVRAYVAEPDLGKIYPGMLADIITDTKTSPIYQGYVGFISPLAEFTPKNVETPDLRTDLVYRLRIIINNPDSGLRQGMPVTVKLRIKKEEKSTLNGKSC